MSSLPRILIAEDEVLVSLVLEDMLQELGYEVDSASDIETALRCATASDYSAAILDFHLHGKKVDPVAQVLANRGIPYAIASGMDYEDMRSALVNVPLLPKPYVMDDVARVLCRLLSLRMQEAHPTSEQMRHLTESRRDDQMA
jgi:DNA-binding response OmpR family regulator